MLVKWNDFGNQPLDRTLSVFDELRREMDRVFDEFHRDFGFAMPSFGLGTPFEVRSLGPKFQLADEGDALVVKAELPGMSEKDLSISLEPGTVTIRGERKDDTPEGYFAHRKERSAYSFSRAFSLPCKIDADKAEATLKNGILTLSLKKADDAKPRHIEVNA